MSKTNRRTKSKTKEQIRFELQFYIEQGALCVKLPTGRCTPVMERKSKQVTSSVKRDVLARLQYRGLVDQDVDLKHFVLVPERR